MRSGACSVQQALTIEAASVLKQSLSLARRRGHAQVTPLHVAATLLTTSSSSNLLRRACLKSQQPHHHHHLASSPHPLHCRALELCFNVALNRLPTTPPPSSSYIHTNPSLSNALIAALKRAQAHQRRGCIDHHQQQPLLSIKVELDQLILSILDDPSVSRVMREAGFSSTTVKSNLEEDTHTSTTTSSIMVPSSLLSPPPSFWSALLLKPSAPAADQQQIPAAHFSSHKEEDLKVVSEVMLRKRGRRNNAVVVGDSASLAEGVVAELMGRVERGAAPDGLNYSHFVRLQLSYLHLRLMSRGEVDASVSDLKRRVAASLASEETTRGRGGVIIYVGDLKWALDDDEVRRDATSFSAVEHLVEQVGALVTATGSSSSSCKVWLMATACYQTYMRCQARHPSLETQWGLQAVMVPSGGPRLSLQAPSVLDSRVTKLTQYPFQMLYPNSFNPKEDEDNKLLFCAECSSEFHKEAEANDTSSASTQLPYWLQPHKPDNHHKKHHLLELKRKWNRLCQNLHSNRHRTDLVPSSNPWWSTSSTDSKNKASMETRSINLSESSPRLINHEGSITTSDVRTTLALGNPLLSDAATSRDPKKGSVTVNSRELHKRLQENIPWQSETIPLIVEALLERQSSEKKGTWVLAQGTDRIGKRRLARVAAECLCGSTSKLIHIDSISERGIKTLKEALRTEPNCLVLIEDIDRAPTELMRTLAEGIKNGFLKDHFGAEMSLAHWIFILTTSTSVKLNDHGDENPNRVLKMRMREEEISNTNRKGKNQETDISSDGKKIKRRTSLGNEMELDLNVSAEESDLTHEIMDYSDDEVHRLPDGLLESIGVHITMNESTGLGHRLADSYIMRMRSSFFDGQLSVDHTAIEGLIGAMGWFLESDFERWVKEVFESSLVMVRKGGKAVELGIEGIEGNVGECGFLGSVLPKRIHVD